MRRLLAALTSLGLAVAGSFAAAQETTLPTPTPPTPNELPSGSSQAPQADRPELTFEQVIAMARKNNRTI